MKIEEVILKKAYNSLLSLNKKEIPIKEAYFKSSCIRFDKKATDEILKELQSKGYIKIENGKRKRIKLFF